jgi:hypothetical protein
MLSAMGVGGTEGMTSFYDSCLGTLYPPGQCAEECTPSMMHCRLMEVQAACCGDPANCPDGDPVPHSCPVECALVFPFFLESCHDVLEAQGGEMRLYERFSQACTRQDTTALVEYAADLIEQGCSVDLGGLRRLAEPAKTAEKAAQSPVVYDNRRLQALGSGACEGFMDDPSGDLAAHGVSCDQVVVLGCDTDLSAIQPTMPRGSLVSFSCPVSCEECHRKGMAQWIETPNDCVWDTFDDRLNEVNEICCAADGADPDATCPRGGPPRACSPLCAVTFHSLTVDCGQKLLSLAGERQAASFTAFDELCTSERSVDPMVFLDAIATAECGFCTPPNEGVECIKEIQDDGAMGCSLSLDGVGTEQDRLLRCRFSNLGCDEDNCAACATERACLDVPGAGYASPCAWSGGCTPALISPYDPYDCTYTKYTNSLPMQDAETACTVLGGHLASIHTPEQQQAVGAVGAAGSWIGLHDRRFEGGCTGQNDNPGFIWTDATPTDFLTWGGGEPNDWQDGARNRCRGMVGEDCAHVRGDNNWNDAGCGGARAYICQDCGGGTVPIPGPTSYAKIDSAGGMLDAEGLCASSGGHLASIHSDEDKDAVAALSPNGAWIGFRASSVTCSVDGGFVWTDGTASDYSSWGGGEPNDWQDYDCEHEGCSHVRGDNNWNDAGCGGNRAAICGFNDAWIQPHSGR